MLSVQLKFVAGSELVVTDAHNTKSGGVLSAKYATHDLAFCNFTQSSTDLYGGAISLESGAKADCSYCNLTANLANEGGGAVFLDTLSSIAFDTSVLSGNKVDPANAIGESPQGGGVVYMHQGSGTVVFKDSTISGNEAKTSWGGGVALVGPPGKTEDANTNVGSLQFAGTTKVQNNHAEFGGVVLTENPNTNILYGEAVVLSGNIAEQRGGVMAVVSDKDPATLLEHFMVTQFGTGNKAKAASGGGDLIWWANPNKCFSKEQCDSVLMRDGTATVAGAAASAFGSGPLSISSPELSAASVPAGQRFDSKWVLHDCYGSDVSVLNTAAAAQAETAVHFQLNSKNCSVDPPSWAWTNTEGGTIVHNTDITRSSKDSSCTLLVTLEPIEKDPLASAPLTVLTGFAATHTIVIESGQFKCHGHGKKMNSEGNCEGGGPNIGLYLGLAALGLTLLIIAVAVVRFYLKRRREKSGGEYNTFDVELAHNLF